MLKTPDLLLFFCLVGATNALYKQWIPDTNYENRTNWDKGDVPCGNDIALFSGQRKVSVFVESMHAVREMRLPIDGEFILNPGAGFYVLSGQDPSCGAGVTAQFKDSESLQWFNPTLWQAAATLDDLQHGNLLFSVHEESVPCQHDDVVFKALSSFRVDTGSSQANIPVKSVSVLGKMFERKSDFYKYLRSQTGQLQFQGSSAVTVGNPGCQDPSGCDCGNSANHQQICRTITCNPATCKKPLLPTGHCCEMCGAIVTIDYAAGFNLQNYRERIRHLFLISSQYNSIQLGMSKVLKSHKLMGIIPFGTSPEIQVVILDGQSGALAETLARDIVRDARSHGSKLGITGMEFQASSGSSSEQSGSIAGTVVGAVFSVLLVITLIIVLVFLVRKGVVRMPSMPSVPSTLPWQRNTDAGLDGTIDHGFNNPMFDKPDTLSDIPGLYEANRNSIALTESGVYFINPSYDENAADITV